MRPLLSQLKDRRSTLARMIRILDTVEGEHIPTALLGDLNIDLNPLDIQTGATHPTARPYFLPRHTIPPCRTIKETVNDRILDRIKSYDAGTLRRYEKVFGSCTSFSAALHLTLTSYSFLGHEPEPPKEPVHPDPMGSGWRSIKCRRMLEQPRHHEVSHWASYGESFQNDICSHSRSRPSAFTNASSDREHHVPPTKDLSEAASLWSSHEFSGITVLISLERFISVTEVIAILRCILHGVKLQIEEVKKLEKNKCSLDHFHRLLPRIAIVSGRFFSSRVLYAYFDDEKLRVQYTEPLYFQQFNKMPQSGLTFMDSVDWDEHWKTMDTLMKWVRPVIQGDILS